MLTLSIALNKNCVKTLWNDPPTFVLLFRLNMDGIYNFQFLSVICSCEFDIVIDADSAEGKEAVCCTHMQRTCPKPWIIDTSNEVGQCVLKQVGTILPKDVRKGYSLAGWFVSYLDRLSAHAKGSDWGLSPNVLQMILPPINGGRMPLYLLTMLQPCGHLSILIFVICCAEGILCQIDMKSF